MEPNPVSGKLIVCTAQSTHSVLQCCSRERSTTVQFNCLSTEADLSNWVSRKSLSKKIKTTKILRNEINEEKFRETATHQEIFNLWQVLKNFLVMDNYESRFQCKYELWSITQFLFIKTDVKTSKSLYDNFRSILSNTKQYVQLLQFHSNEEMEWIKRS